MRVEPIAIGVLFSGALACTSILGTRDLYLDDPGTGGAATSGPSVTKAAEAGTDERHADAGHDADAHQEEEVDAGPPINFARENGVTATATTTYAGFPASRLVDGDLQTSWYSDTGACTAAGASCVNVSTRLTLAGTRTVGRLVVYGNNDKFTDFDVVTGRWELLASNGTVLSKANITLSPPTYDGTTVLPAAIANVAAVRFVVLTGDASDPGLGEIEIYAR